MFLQFRLRFIRVQFRFRFTFPVTSSEQRQNWVCCCVWERIEQWATEKRSQSAHTRSTSWLRARGPSRTLSRWWEWGSPNWFSSRALYEWVPCRRCPFWWNCLCELSQRTSTLCIIINSTDPKHYRAVAGPGVPGRGRLLPNAKGIPFHRIGLHSSWRWR